MEEKIPIVEIEKIHFKDNYYEDKGYRWSAFKLIEHSKGLPIFDLPLAAIHIGICLWGAETGLTIDEFVHHMKRSLESDLRYPIILDDQGQICDGWHRLCKAIVNGHSTIKAIRLNDMPEPDSILETPNHGTKKNS